MISIIIRFLLALFVNYQVHAENVDSIYQDVSIEQKNLWTITAILESEQAEHYGFIFNISHQNQAFHAIASIFNIEQKKILWSFEENLLIKNSDDPGKQFKNFSWHYNPINSTLVISCTDTNHQGFHLKFDLLEPTTIHKKLSLTQHLKLKQYWSGSINGHIRTPEEIFVTSENASIQNVWQDNQDKNQHIYQDLLCRFTNGESVSAIQIPELDAIRASYANWLNAQGKKQSISQFIPLAFDENTLHQNIKLTQTNIELERLWNYQQTHMYIAEMNNSFGFCVHQKDPWLTVMSLHDVSPIPKDNFLNKTIALTKKPFKIPFILKDKITS